MMSWERQKSTISEEPEEPSSTLWLMLGVVSLVVSVLLFVIHANKLAGPLQEFNIWIVAAAPLVAWFIFLCLRGWLYNEACDKHQFDSDEADYAQQKWTTWAGRHIAVLHSGVMLPDSLAPALLLTAPPVLEQNIRLTKRIRLPAGKDPFSVLLTGMGNVLAKLPADLPFTVTLLTDTGEDPATLQTTFAKVWQANISLRPVPALICCDSKSFLSVEERIKFPTLNVELLLVHQMQGGEIYSDALAALLLTSDDVATKYQLGHRARLLRPMLLDPTQELHTELDTFFSTQSQANTTDAIVGDAMAWGNLFSTLLASTKEYNGNWKPEQCHWLEKYAGLSGPFSPWIMAAVVSDIVALTQSDCLMLSEDNDHRFINTITTGDPVNGQG
ncbi:hypothetical protein [Erwinia sp. E_sp_B04_7]|uniref:hypothetical protein n=1 Tax=unclassified Erwinia TaxID=2622719 RepID=UPI0030D305B1